jgi:small-conductance mechanosensitive channel
VPSNLGPREIYDYLVWLFTSTVDISAGGGMRVSIKSLLTGALILLVAMRVSRMAQSLLRRRVLAHVPIDPGLGYTLERMLHYAVVTLGVLFALRVGANIDFTGVAVVLTALSVGIGLGLKEIASDVAAGFVLLFERPLRVGDRVRLGGSAGVEGDVVAIDLRTTKVLTPDGLTVIVPNSKLTNEQYVNWSYRNQPVRLHVPVGVAYDSDVDVVRDALVDAAHGVEGVLEDPGPSVRLVNFGESSLDFELLVWTRSPERHAQIRSDLNFNIRRELTAAGVEIPYPQRDLNVRTLPQGVAGS